MKIFTKDPDSILDYAWDWSEWLGTDTIQSFSFIIPDDFTEVDSSESEGLVTIWLSGGLVNKSYTVTCEIVTVGGRTEHRSAIFMLQER